MLLWQIDSSHNLERVEPLLKMALADAQRLQIPEVGQIEGIMQKMGLAG